MAAVEKICEYSGHYVGPQMYKYKKNRIQVSPKYYKKFRGCKATLTFYEKDLCIAKKGCGTTLYVPSALKSYVPPFKNLKEYLEYLNTWEGHHRTLYRYEYVLEVKHKDGTTKDYFNYTYGGKSAVIRKLKRLVGAKNLTVVTAV